MSKKAGKTEKLGKKEKLDLILSALGKLTNEIKALGKQQATLLERVGKRPARPVAKPAAKKPAKVSAAAKPARKSGAAPKRPVLVSPAETVPAPARTAAQ